MKLTKPYLKKRSDNSEPQKNKIINNIEDLFISNNKISFHFGVPKDSNVRFAWEILLADTQLSKDDSNTVVQETINVLTKKSILMNTKFLSLKNIEYGIIVFYDKYQWNLEGNIIFKINYDLNKDDFIITTFTQKQFQEHMVSIFGINRTNKPLIYSTTEYEGYLSDISRPNSYRNDITLFPGDVDLLIYNNTYIPVSLIEFKKHTAFGYGKIESESFLKYFSRDQKKYQSLAQIAEQIGLRYFFNIIYSTRPNELTKIKIEKIGVDLKLIGSTIHQFNTISELENIFSKLM